MHTKNPPACFFRFQVSSFKFHSQRGVALVIILAFIVLLTGVVVAFFSRAVSERQVSNSSASQTKAEIFAQGATDQIISDLKQEIAAGSNSSSPAAGVTIYQPKDPNTFIPADQGLVRRYDATTKLENDDLNNLVKRSANRFAFYPTTNYDANASNRASGVSTSAPSQNGRFVSAARWNKPLLFPTDPLKNIKPDETDLTPKLSSGTFTPPDWILIGRDGSNPTTFGSGASSVANSASTNFVVGRYAYNIYDEGGLLDANAAGFPSTTTPQQASFKNALAYVDLRQLPGLTTLSPADQNAVVDAIAGWRNYASVALDLTKNPVTNTDGFAGADKFPTYTWNDQRAKNIFNFTLSDKSGSLKAGNVELVNGQSNRLFTSRQQLINLLESIGKTVNAFTPALQQQTLQYLSTFTRDLNQPSYIPAVHSSATAPRVLSAAQGGTNAVGSDEQINPSYTTVRATKAFTRNDGTPVNVGDALVKRFPLQRLAWLTHRGPSSGRSAGDTDIQKLMQEGVPWSYLQLGTADNIRKSFGLTWDNAGGQWLYNVHNNKNGAGRGPIMRVGRNPAITPGADANTYVQDLADGREPDFFEMLKSAITVGSLGKALASSSTAVDADVGGSVSEQPYNYNHVPETSTDRQIIQIGANIINQSRPDNYPVVIRFDDGSGLTHTPYTIAGVANLPYLYEIMVGVLQLQAPSPLPRAGSQGTPATPATQTAPAKPAIPPYSGAPGSGRSGDAGYSSGNTPEIPTADVITVSGAGAIMQMPVVWNPHDPSSPAAVVGPTEFRVVADSTTPDLVGSSLSNYESYFAYSSSSSAQGNHNSYDGISPNSTWYSSPGGTGDGISHTITATNSEIDFTAASAAVQLFPEPTILWRDATIRDSNNNDVAVKLGDAPLMGIDPAVSSFFSDANKKGLKNYVAPATDANLGPATVYLGFYLGAFPFAWSHSPTEAPSSGAQSGVTIARATGAIPPTFKACYLTYRMQSRDAGGNWITYDTKYGKVQEGGIIIWNNDFGNFSSTSARGVLLAQGGYWGTVTDPRTSRFGIQWNGTSNTAGTNNPVTSNHLSESVLKAGYLNAQRGIIKSNRPDAQAGFYFMANWKNAGMPSAGSGWMAWVGSDASSFPGLTPGLLAQNNSDIHYSPSRSYNDPEGSGTHTPNYFADPDGIVRRGMGAFVPIGTSNSPSNRTTPPDNRTPSADTTVGLPAARAFGPAPNPPGASATTTNYTAGSTLSQAQSRPYFLHRPFRSVAELGYVFTDTPWRNLDFFTAESGNTALLDVFCINEIDNPSGLVAGKVNLNTKQTPVLQAILAGAYLDPANVTGNNSVTKPLDATTASNVATALTAYLATNGPVQNIAELIGKWNANVAIAHPNTRTSHPPLAPPFYDGKLSYIGFSGGVWDKSAHKPQTTSPATDIYSAYMSSSSPFATSSSSNGTRETVTYIQRYREAPIRALSSVGQTRTWNLMIDLIAQTGRYGTNATALDQFSVEGEQRYWVHLAIDRLTGKVIDKQIEVVKE